MPCACINASLVSSVSRITQVSRAAQVRSVGYSSALGVNPPKTIRFCCSLNHLDAASTCEHLVRAVVRCYPSLCMAACLLQPHSYALQPQSASARCPAAMHHMPTRQCRPAGGAAAAAHPRARKRHASSIITRSGASAASAPLLAGHQLAHSAAACDDCRCRAVAEQCPGDEAAGKAHYVETMPQCERPL